ncbi:MAG: 1-deoxy-D-xylulose-5-phosphate reductoisomerase [Oscillospiraceae bacterium]|jgi:1-deoxy-D-xylulose-5-phosphate reductoisomerase|nr:1-deoxy-D-xylulose-5-phosphate reductoisomerase [Oscillospiraceae bacterium]
MKRIAVLGSTGSIGAQALDVVERLGYGVAALTAQSNAKLLEAQARKYRPQAVALADKTAAQSLRIALNDTDIPVLSGPEGVVECAAMACDCALNAIVGIAGLAPTIAALRAGNPLALANKESLVTGGALVTELAKKQNLPILPVDSEHSAIFQCLRGAPAGSLRRVILTASGGAFYGKNREGLARVTAADALKHPTWAMGAKITVDCATMMNKGLEVIEAAWLFGLPAERIDVLVHRQSVVHSLVELADGAVMAQLGAPDMRLPIQYALTYPERLPSPAERLDLTTCGALTFEPPDEEAFPAVALCREAFERGGLAPVALNGANEAANALFRQGKIGFPDITRLVSRAMEAAPPGEADDLEKILSADRYAREMTYKYM